MQGIFLDSEFTLKEEKEPYWWSEEKIQLILDCIFNNPFFELIYYGDAVKSKKIKTIEAVLKTVLRKGGPTTFYSEKKDHNEEISVGFNHKTSIDPASLRFYFSIPLEKVESVPQIQDYIWFILDKLSPIAMILNSVKASYKEGDLDFPRRRPLRFYGMFSEFAFINVFDKAYFEKYTYHNQMPKENAPTIIKAIEEDTSLNTTIKGNLIAVTWANSLEKEELESSFSFREDYIQSRIPLPPAMDNNEEGDQVIDTLVNIYRFEKLSASEYFSFYDTRNKWALKAIVLEGGTTLSASDKKQIQHYYQSKVLKDGRPVEKIIALVPARKYVFEVDKVAQEVGIYKTWYVDDDMDCWDVNPPGNWKN